MKRRSFFKILGLAGAAEALLGFSSQAAAATWQKVGGASVAAKVRFPQKNQIRKNMTVAGGSTHSAVIRSDGLVYTAGLNTSGQLGDNSVTSRRTFVQATGISNAVAVACGETFTYALRSDGLVFGTGYDINGQVGINGGLSNISTFIQCTGISDAIAIAAGNLHGAALRADGLVFTVGRGLYGSLGSNSTAARYTFQQATGVSNAVAIACGLDATYALRADGLVFCTGTNIRGGLGDNTVTSRRTFIQATGISNAIAIAAGGYCVLALRADGLVFGTGENGAGQIGDNTILERYTFVQATGISNAIAVVGCHSGTVAALRADGLMFSGYAADGTITRTYAQIVGVSNIVAIGYGNVFSQVLTSDGVLHANGSNTNGQLGDNTATDKTTFVQPIGI